MALQDDIIERINQRLIIEANKLEGGFSQDIIGSVAYEFANIEEVVIPNIIKNSFASTAQDEALDNVFSDYGVERKQATNALVDLRITGVQGTFINESVQALYDNISFTILESGRIGASGVITLRAKCDVAGSIGLVDANTITKFAGNYAGLISVTNPNSSFDGFDREDDEQFRARGLEIIREVAANCNEEQYKLWALSIAGVTRANVLSAEEVGAGNVGVYIGTNEGTASQELIDKVKTYIEGQQFINANVIVGSLTAVNININAILTLAIGTQIGDVKAQFLDLLSNYLKEVDTVVSYFKVTDLLLQCSGVEDVNTLTLNGGTSSVEIGKTQVAKVNEVNLSEHL